MYPPDHPLPFYNQRQAYVTSSADCMAPPPIVSQTCRRHTAAVSATQAALDDLTALKTSSTADEIDAWDIMARDAQTQRVLDPKAMDIFDSNMKLRESLG